MSDNSRFAFGKNWQDFNGDANEDRIRRAEDSLRRITGLNSFSGKTFLDAGCGSGLFSLAARRLGASVVSFDYDENSVAATRELKARFMPDDGEWKISPGDVLDKDEMLAGGRYDIVYSWGVLHHTGNMRRAFENIATAVGPGGLLCIAIYNDEGRYSKMWLFIKKLYNRLPNDFLKQSLVAFVACVLECRLALARILSFQNPLPRWSERNRQSLRGMSVWHDYIDWVGGLPFEVAKPDAVFSFFHDRGFNLVNMTTVGRGHGCNEYVFRLNTLENSHELAASDRKRCG